MSRMENPGRGKSNKDLQMSLEFKGENFETLKEVKMKEIDSKYPYAKLDPSRVSMNEKGEWLFNDQPLENQAFLNNEAYKPDEGESWINK